MTTPTQPPTAEDHRTEMEKHWDAILPTLATKEDVARLETRFDSLEDKMDAMANRLLLWSSVIMIAAVAASATAAFVAARCF